MEPLSSLTAAAIATLVMTKTFEKVGEKLGDEVFTEGGKLVQLIRQHSPQTAGAIEIAQKTPDDFGQAVLENVEADAKHPEIAAAVEKVAEIAKADPNFGKAIQKVEEIVKSSSVTINNYGKLADEIGKIASVNYGTIERQDFHF